MIYPFTQGSVIAPPAPAIPEVGAFWVSGIFEGTVDFDPDGPSPVTRTANTDRDGFVAQFDANYELIRVHRISHTATNSPRTLYGLSGGFSDTTLPIAVNHQDGSIIFPVVATGGDAEVLDESDASFGAPGPVTFPQQDVSGQQVGFCCLDSDGTLRWFKGFPFTGGAITSSGTRTRYPVCAVSSDGSRAVLAFSVRYNEPAPIVLDPGLGDIPNDRSGTAAMPGVLLVVDTADGSVIRQEYTREVGETDDTDVHAWAISDMRKSDDVVVGWQTRGDMGDEVEWDSGGTDAAQDGFVSNQSLRLGYSRHSLVSFQHTLFHQDDIQNTTDYAAGGQTAVDSSGSAYFAAMTPNNGAVVNMERTPTTLSSSSTITAPSILLACHDSDGDEVWVQEWTRTDNLGDVLGMALNLDESVLVVALTNRATSTSVTVTVDGNAIVMPGRSSVLLGLDPADGSLLWEKQPTGNDIQIRQIDVQRQSGVVLVAASAQSNGADLDFGEVTIPDSTWGTGAETTPFVWVLTEDGASATTTHVVRIHDASGGNQNHAIGVGGY